MSTLDRDAARDALDNSVDRYWHGDQDDLLDALEGCVRPAPAQTINRDALEAVIDDDSLHPATTEKLASRILNLLRPVDGVTLTRDEAAMAAEALRYASGRSPEVSLRAALAARLEATQ